MRGHPDYGYNLLVDAADISDVVLDVCRLPSVFEEIRQRGMAGGTHPHEGRWIDVGTVAEYERAIAIYGSGRR